jgi:phage-related protein
MSLDEILKFKVLFYSPDRVNSPVTDYLNDLMKKNQEATIKCIDELQDLPLLISTRAKNIKTFKHGKHNFFELKVKYKNNEFRFFFIMEKPKIITVYGFTKKTQKTEKRDISQGINFLEMYLSDKNTINPFDNL